MKPTSTSTIHIDGSFGEGGGQIIRTALSLAMLTQTPIHITNIRAGRKKSGLMRQHLVCVKSAQAISHATVTGAELGSSELTFTPHTIQGGGALEKNWRFEIGSAGSTSLVLQTLLPALLFSKIKVSTSDLAKSESKNLTLTITGGTHNPLAPTADFLQQAFFPALQNMGISVDYQVKKVGFAPIGGGEVTASFSAVDFDNIKPLNLTKRGELISIDLVAGELNLSHDILQRELKTALDKIVKDNKLTNDQITTQYHSWHNVGEGNSCHAVAKFQIGNNVHNMVHQEVFTLLGEKGTSAENIGKRLAGQVSRYLHAPACVDEYLTDQLLLPLALIAEAGKKPSQFTARLISEHTRTQALMIEKFLNVKIGFEEMGKDCVLVKIGRNKG